MSASKKTFLKGEKLKITHSYRGEFSCEVIAQTDDNTLRVTVFQNIYEYGRCAYRVGEFMYVNILNCKQITVIE